MEQRVVKKRKYDNDPLHNFKNNVVIEDDTLSDVTFVIGHERKKFKGIKLLFAIQSEIFRNLFFGPSKFKECVDNEVIINDITSDAFQFIKDTFYLLQPQLACDTVIDVYYCANKYCLDAITESCIVFIHHNITNTATLYAVLSSMNQYNSNVFDDIFPEIFENNDFITNGESFTAIINHDKFTSVMQSSHVHLLLKYTIFNDRENEKLKFEAAVKWATANQSKFPLKTVIKPILKEINFRKFNEEYLYKTVRTSNVMSSDEFIQIMTDRWKKSKIHIKDLMLTQKEIDALKPNDYVDFRDIRGLYCLTKVISRMDDILNVMVEETNEQIDAMCSVNQCLLRAGSISGGCEHDCENDHSLYSVGNFVQFNVGYHKDLFYKYDGTWCTAMVIECNFEEGKFCNVQLWVNFDDEGSPSNFFYNGYVDNSDEIRPIPYTVVNGLISKGFVDPPLLQTLDFLE